MAQLYRKSSIEKLSNPDQLDKTITVTSPMSWIALISVVLIIVAVMVWAFIGTIPTTISIEGIIVDTENIGAYHSNKSGVVAELMIKPGDIVEKGQSIAKIKTTSGDSHTVVATANGTISAQLAQVGDNVALGTEIARYTPQSSGDMAVVCYVPVATAQQLKDGMKVLVYPSSIDSQKYGHIEAEIESIGEYAVSSGNMWYVLGADNLVADQFLSNGPVISVVCKLKTDSSTKSGFLWTSQNAKNIIIPNGTFASTKIVVDECAPISKLFNNLKDGMEG